VTAATDLIADRTRLRALRLTLFLESCWREEAASGDQGLSITPGEVRRHLLAPADSAQARSDFYTSDEAAGDLSDAIAQADAALADDPRWQRLVGAFGLSGVEADLLVATIALLVRPELGRVYAYLQDDVNAVLPSIALVRELFEPVEDQLPFEPFALRRWRLAEPEPAAPIPAKAGWHALPALTRTLAGGAWNDPALEGSVELKPPRWGADLTRLQEEAASRAAARLDSGHVADLAAPRGSGRRTVAAQLAADRHERFLLIDSRQLVSGSDSPAEKLIAALRMAKFEGALACFTAASAVTAEQWRQVPLGDLPVVRCYEPGEIGLQDVAALTLAPLALAARLSLWRELSEEEPPAAITANRVTAGEIARLAAHEGSDASDEPVPELLTRLPTPYTWDDLILPEETRNALKDFGEQVRLRGPVLETWGFDRLSHLGSGLVALLAGPSGVGKTMAAQVLARDLGLQLFRVDLAGVVDKYIGETEKRLRTAFAFAERPGVLLLFDEADALFGTRTQARDSHDRYANLEINYLLQRIETFEGVAILATNRKSELDPAFRRRLRTTIDFRSPGPTQRLRLWQLALPDLTPAKEQLCEGIDHAMLADELSLNGADIKAAALGAAFLARAEGTPIRMQHVLAATQREMAKQGQAIRLPLAEVKAR
jgi:SpoVK/Ycf46/Vps4 family AAA+-type ATPase